MKNNTPHNANPHRIAQTASDKNVPLGDKEMTTYYVRDPQGNVLAVITPDASDATQPAIESLTDYYPFGMEEPGRSYSTEGYRYGFNGKENVFDDSQDYGERIYKPNIARFLSADPLIVFNQEYPELSPYQFASNTPIGAIDLDGLEAFLAIAGNAYGAAWDKNHRKFFKAQAERLEKTYAEYSAYTVSTGEDILKIMIEATQREGSISSIAFFTHGGDLGFYLNNDAGLFYNSSVVSPKPGAKTWDDIADAIKKGLIKFEENSTIFIDACNVGAISPSYFPGKDVSRLDALASKISRITGATVIAAVGHCEMQDQTKADGKFKISNREVEREGMKLHYMTGLLMDPIMLAFINIKEE